MYLLIIISMIFIFYCTVFYVFTLDFFRYARAYRAFN